MTLKKLLIMLTIAVAATAWIFAILVAIKIATPKLILPANERTIVITLDDAGTIESITNNTKWDVRDVSIKVNARRSARLRGQP